MNQTNPARIIRAGFFRGTRHVPVGSGSGRLQAKSRSGPGFACAVPLPMPAHPNVIVGLETLPGPPVRVVLTFRDPGARQGIVISMRPRSAAAVWALLGAQCNGEDMADAEVQIHAELEVTADAAPAVP